MTSDLVAKVIEMKRNFYWLDKLLPDSSLIRALERDPKAEDPAGPITLAGCLNHCDYPVPFPPHPALLALDSNLAVLWNRIDKPSRLRNKLLNPEQFLNTISELALARTLHDDGYEITLEFAFAERRDADVLATKSGRDYHIEVTNLASRPIISGTTIAGSVREVAEYDLIVEKIITKFRDKFEGPLDRGWHGHAWIALDVAKNDEENVHLVLQRFSRPTWRDELKAILCRECSTLEGALVYRSAAIATHVDIVGWVECAV
jgi:hypothetical protein